MVTNANATPAIKLAMAGGSRRMASRPLGFFSFFWYAFFSIFIYLYSTNDFYLEVINDNDERQNQQQHEQRANGPTAGLKMWFVSSPQAQFFSIFFSYVSYIILMPVITYRYCEQQKGMPTPTLATGKRRTAGLETHCVSSPKFLVCFFSIFFFSFLFVN